MLSLRCALYSRAQYILVFFRHKRICNFGSFLSRFISSLGDCCGITVELYRRYCCGIVTFGCGIVSALRNGACCNFWSFISRRFALRVSCFRVKNIIFPSLSTWLRIPWAAIMWSMLPPFTRCAKFVSSCGTSLWRSIIDISFAPKSPFESRYNCRVQQRGWDNAPDLHLSIHIIHSWQCFEFLCSNVPALSIQKQDSLCNTE